MGRLRISLTVLATLAVAVGACGTDAPTGAVDPAPPIGPASLEQLTGPWRAAPLVVDAAMRAKITVACRREVEVPPGAQVAAVLIDVRGEGVAVVRLDGQVSAGCDALHIRRNGDVVGAGGGWRAEGPVVQPAVEAFRLADIEVGTVGGGDLAVTGWLVQGRAGPGIATVTAQSMNGPRATATVSDGWFAAWWPRQPGDPDPLEARGPQQPPIVVRGYDALGDLRAEITP